MNRRLSLPVGSVGNYEPRDPSLAAYRGAGDALNASLPAYRGAGEALNMSLPAYCVASPPGFDFNFNQVVDPSHRRASLGFSPASSSSSSSFIDHYSTPTPTRNPTSGRGRDYDNLHRHYDAADSSFDASPNRSCYWATNAAFSPFRGGGGGRGGGSGGVGGGSANGRNYSSPLNSPSSRFTTPDRGPKRPSQDSTDDPAHNRRRTK